MLKVSDIIGFPIVCTEQRKFRGEVKDAILDLNSFCVVGLVVDHGSLIHHTRVIPFNSIYGINKNKVIVKFKKNMQHMNNFDFQNNFIKKNEMISGTEVVGEDENLLGFIKDIIFEEKSGNILGFVITNGLVDDIFNGIEILPFNNSIRFEKNKVFILKDIKNSILRNVGGLKKLLELEH
ncbi:MAG: PRC-barrel domain-containing protein [Maledivibacter sp.]|jgi:uncharacterized protein YrrD|nr:PRC-barrel domain-containing protein [Maledivibacter sp.]